MKKMGLALGIIILVFAGLVIMKNILAQTLFQSGVKALTGLSVDTGSMDFGVYKTYVGLKDFKVHNPLGFSGKIMAVFPEIYVDYKLRDFFSGLIHFEKLRIHLQELTVERNKNNQVNIQALKTLAPPQGEGTPPKVQIDSLQLTIDKVIYKDYGLPEPLVKEFNINFNQEFKNVTDPKAVVNLIIVKALSKTNIAALTGLDLSNIQREVSQAIQQQAESLMQGLKLKAGQALDQATQGLQKIFSPETGK